MQKKISVKVSTGSPKPEQPKFGSKSAPTVKTVESVLPAKPVVQPVEIAPILPRIDPQVLAAKAAALRQSLSVSQTAGGAALPQSSVGRTFGLKSEPKSKRQKLYFLHMSVKEKILFVKRLGIMLKAGVPILQSIRMLKEQASSRVTSHILDSLEEDVENGQYLHVSLEKYKKIFGEFILNLIRIGEISGTLHENLNYLADELQKKQALRRKVISAMVYPVFIVLATLGITILLTVYVFPKILPIIRSFSEELPMSTRIMVFISNFVSDYWHVSFLAIILTIVGFVLALRNYKFKLKSDRMIIRYPLLGRIFQGYHISNTCRSLGILLRSNVRIVESINITAKTTTNLAYRIKLEQLAEAVTRGERIAPFLETDKKLFPAMMSQMVGVGETTGHLSDSLMYLAEIYEAEVEDLTKNLSTVLEPVLMVFMGFLVGFVAISIITPIYSLSQNLHP